MAVVSYLRETIIHAEPEEVFDFCSDLCNELVENPNAEHVEKLDAGPVDVGTRVEARWANTGKVEVEVVEFDPPRTWTTRSATRGMDVLFRGTVTDVEGGAHYSARMVLKPKGPARLYAPLALLAMRRQEATNLRLIKETLEANPVVGERPPRSL